MIKNINVKNFGLFNNYSWNTSIGKDYEFKKLNIIYGRNYSGKTTLSRMFRCFELAEKHMHYLDCNYSLTISDDSVITSSNIDKFNCKIRVYNSDFIKDNLSWLHKEDGTILPFTILGAKNVELDTKIKAIEEEIGNVEDNKGLLYKRFLAFNEYEKKINEYKKKADELENKLISKAREIKNKATVYNLPLYQINSIRTDMLKIDESSILSEDQIEERFKLIREEPYVDIKELLEQKANFAEYLFKSNELITKKLSRRNL